MTYSNSLNTFSEKPLSVYCCCFKLVLWTLLVLNVFISLMAPEDRHDDLSLCQSFMTTSPSARAMLLDQWMSPGLWQQHKYSFYCGQKGLNVCSLRSSTLWTWWCIYGVFNGKLFCHWDDAALFLSMWKSEAHLSIFETPIYCYMEVKSIHTVQKVKVAKGQGGKSANVHISSLARTYYVSFSSLFGYKVKIKSPLWC